MASSSSAKARLMRGPDIAEEEEEEIEYKFKSPRKWAKADQEYTYYKKELAKYKKQKKAYEKKAIRYVKKKDAAEAQAVRDNKKTVTVFGQAKKWSTLSGFERARKELAAGKREGKVVAGQKDKVDQGAVDRIMNAWVLKNPPPASPGPTPSRRSSPGPKPGLRWSKRPGQRGFNKVARRLMIADGIEGELQMGCERPADGSFRPQAYQRTVEWMVRPGTPMDRMLVVAKTGAGKTYTIIQILNNYYWDPRPKVCIFPTESVAANFYMEICKFPSLYRDYIVTRLGQGILDDIQNEAKAVEALEKVQKLLAMNREMSKRGQPGYLAAPLRSIRYSIAGGATVLPTPKDAFFKLGYKNRGSPYSNKIVLMDEFHNLVRPNAEMEPYKAKLDALAKALTKSTNSVVVGFTATPNPGDIQDGFKLLDIIKQDRDYEDEGWVAFFDSLPRALYPKVIRDSSKRTESKSLAVRTVVKIEGTEKGQNLAQYKEALTKFGKNDNFVAENRMPKDEKVAFKLFNFANISSSYSHLSQAGWEAKYEAAPSLYGTKLNALAELITSKREKTLIMIDRKAGYKALVIAFRVAAKKLGLKEPEGGWCTMYDRSEMGCLAKFNSPGNLRGDLMRTMVVDSSQFSEGVSFFSCRQLWILNPPLNPGNYFQQIGRIIRSCSHSPLDPDERDVQLNFLVGDPGPGIFSIDEIAYDSLEKSVARYLEELDFFRRVAVDKPFIEAFE